jgi:hypothetical protein
MDDSDDQRDVQVVAGTVSYLTEAFWFPAPKLASMTRTRSFFYDLLQDVTVQALRSQ